MQIGTRTLPASQFSRSNSPTVSSRSGAPLTEAQTTTSATTETNTRIGQQATELQDRVRDTLSLGSQLSEASALGAGQLNQALQSLRQLTNSGPNASLVMVLQRFQTETLPQNLQNLATSRQELRDVLTSLPRNDPDRPAFELQLQLVERTQDMFMQAKTLLDNSPLLNPSLSPTAPTQALPLSQPVSPPAGLEDSPRLQTAFQNMQPSKQAEFGERFAALDPAQQTAVLSIGSRLLENPPPAGIIESISTTMAGFDRDQRMAIGRTLNSLDVIIPSLAPSAPGAEDFSVRLRQTQMPFFTDVQASYIADYLKISGPENLQVVLQIDYSAPENIQAARTELMQRSGLSADEIDARVRFVATPAQSGWEWGEDNKILTQDGTLLIPPDADWAADQAERFVKADSGRNLDSESSQGIHTATRRRFDPLNAVDPSVFARAIANDDLQNSAVALAEATELNDRQVRTYIEGGNLLVGTLPSGDPYGIIGRDSLITSTFQLEEAFRTTPEDVPEFAPERMTAQRALMGLDQPFDSLSAEQQELIQDTAVRLSTGPILPENQAQMLERATEFLVRQELTKSAIATDLGIDVQNLVFISQPDFHIDMQLRPTRPGEVLVNDFAANEALIDNALTRATPGSWEETELQTMRLRNRETAAVMAPVMAQISQQLKAGGLTPIPAPGVMDTSPSGNFPPEAYSNNSNRDNVRFVNFMNAVPSTRMGSNEQIYLTNATSIGPLQAAYSDYLRDNLGVEQVYFLGSDEGGANAPNIAEISLMRGGGFDCRGVHFSSFFDF